jgi:hypothetical protein
MWISLHEGKSNVRWRLLKHILLLSEMQNCVDVMMSEFPMNQKHSE